MLQKVLQQSARPKKLWNKWEHFKSNNLERFTGQNYPFSFFRPSATVRTEYHGLIDTGMTDYLNTLSDRYTLEMFCAWFKLLLWVPEIIVFDMSDQRPIGDKYALSDNLSDNMPYRITPCLIGDPSETDMLVSEGSPIRHVSP